MPKAAKKRKFYTQISIRVGKRLHSRIKTIIMESGLLDESDSWYGWGAEALRADKPGVGLMREVFRETGGMKDR